MKSTHISRLRDIFALLTAGIIYWLKIYPHARRELHRWKRHAHAIPDSTLRGHALHKLTDEHLNPEAAAFFAILGPRRHRRRLVRLMVAYQIMYDYLDAINEPEDSAHLTNGLQLHSALTCAVRLRACPVDHYRHHPQQDDGGYLNSLIKTCQDALHALPSTGTVTPLLIHAADRCGEAQSHNHAVLTEGGEQLADWSAIRADEHGYLWWELAAAGISCLAIHALFAAAAVTRMTLHDATNVDMAYFPSICAISALLDSLIDYPHDNGTTNHSFTGHYDSSVLASERLVAIATEGAIMIGRLSQSRRHKVILAGIASFYLSAPEALTEFAKPVTEGVIDSLGKITIPILAVMRLKRRR
jgi:tetraprenyl-beta-curcumene synthase